MQHQPTNLAGSFQAFPAIPPPPFPLQFLPQPNLPHAKYIPYLHIPRHPPPSHPGSQPRHRQTVQILANGPPAAPPLHPPSVTNPPQTFSFPSGHHMQPPPQQPTFEVIQMRPSDGKVNNNNRHTIGRQQQQPMATTYMPFNIIHPPTVAAAPGYGHFPNGMIAPNDVPQQANALIISSVPTMNDGAQTHNRQLQQQTNIHPHHHLDPTAAAQPTVMPMPHNNYNNNYAAIQMASSYPNPPPPAPVPPAPPPQLAPNYQYYPPLPPNQPPHSVANPSASSPTVPSAAEGAEANVGVGVVGGDCWSTAVTGWEQAAMIKNKIGLVINGRFRIVQSIASGSYGDIFAAEDLHSPAGPQRQRVAVKFDGACRDNHLRYEYEVYKSVLYEDANGKVEGFPQVFSWSHEYGHNIMVMELLGAPVASLFAFCDRKFAKQTIVSLGEQMIQRIRHLHQRGFIHRDVKPENFLMGLVGKESTLYLIDFGLARRYRYREGENRTLTHIPYRRGRSFIGTAKYASLNSHKNIELSRRDDLESLAYVLIELVNGHLPWKNISKRNATTRHQASVRIRQLKEQTNWEDYCPCMARFIRYCKEIPFVDEPDYDKLLDLIQLIAVPEFSVQPSNLSIPMRKEFGAVRTKKVTNGVCCLTSETAEKMTQVNLEESTANGESANAKLNGGQPKINNHKTNGTAVTDEVAQTMQRQLSLNAAENVSDFDEIGAATTTTSCSENEMESGDADGGGGGNTNQSGTGTADDEGSQPTPQQEQQQVCRKCKKLRDQQQQNQQKRTKDQQQKIKQQSKIDTGLQTDNQPFFQIQMREKSTGGQRKMCWQRARESNPERQFQYENKFSWTILNQVDHPPPPLAIIPPPHHQQQPNPTGLLPLPFPTTANDHSMFPNIMTAPSPPGKMPLIAATFIQPPPPAYQPAFLQFDTRQLGQFNGLPAPPPQNGASTVAAPPLTTGAVHPLLLTSIRPPPMQAHQIQGQKMGGGGMDGRRRLLQVAFVLPPQQQQQN